MMDPQILIFKVSYHWYQVIKSNFISSVVTERAVLKEKKDLDKAHDAYKKALDVSESKKISISPLLQMKFDNLIKDGDEPAFKRAQKLEEVIASSASEIKK